MENEKAKRLDVASLRNDTYAKDGPHNQRFRLNKSMLLDGVTLVVHANYSHPNVICVYAFRVLQKGL